MLFEFFTEGVNCFTLCNRVGLHFVLDGSLICYFAFSVFVSNLFLVQHIDMPCIVWVYLLIWCVIILKDQWEQCMLLFVDTFDNV